MPTSLYKNSDGVIILSDKNFQNGKIVKGFMGSGVIKAYASWCGHCQDKVSGFKGLAKALKDTGMYVYVINADENRKFSEAFNIQGFPTMLFISDNGTVSSLTDDSGNPVYDIPGITQKFCRDYNKLCGYKA